jgi:hypothetical protein
MADGVKFSLLSVFQAHYNSTEGPCWELGTDCPGKKYVFNIQVFIYMYISYAKILDHEWFSKKNIKRTSKHNKRNI